MSVSVSSDRQDGRTDEHNYYISQNTTARRMLGHEYFRALGRSIDHIRSQAPRIADAARLIVDGTVKGGRFYVHDTANMISIEAEGRAGGLLMLKELPLWKLIDIDGSPNDVVVVFANGSDASHSQSGKGILSASFSPMVAFHTMVPNTDIDYRAGALNSSVRSARPSDSDTATTRSSTVCPASMLWPSSTTFRRPNRSA
jgi:hypothetical protein